MARGPGLELHSLFFKTLFGKGFWSDFFDFGWILGGFGDQKRRLKSVFWVLFCDVFFKCFSASILGGFLEAPNPENMHGASTGARFLQNWRFRKSNEKTSILAWFSEAKATKNRGKMMLKRMCFFYIDVFGVFLRCFAIVAGFWEAPGRPKIEKNQNKSEKIDFRTRSVLKDGSERFLGGFWDGFGRIFGKFSMDVGKHWDDFGKILVRAWGTNDD